MRAPSVASLALQAMSAEWKAQHQHLPDQLVQQGATALRAQRLLCCALLELTELQLEVKVLPQHASIAMLGSTALQVLLVKAQRINAHQARTARLVLRSLLPALLARTAMTFRPPVAQVAYCVLKATSALRELRVLP